MTDQERYAALDQRLDTYARVDLSENPGIFGGRLRKYNSNKTGGMTTHAALWEINPSMSFFYEVLYMITIRRRLPGANFEKLDPIQQQVLVDRAKAMLLEVDGGIWFLELTPEEFQQRMGEGF